MSSIICKRSKGSDSDNESEVEEDRISRLPDNLPNQVRCGNLYLIPPLASPLDPHHPHYSLFFYNNPQNDQDLIATFTHILSQLNSPKLHFVSISFSVYSKLVGSSCCVPWIHRICAQNPDVLESHSHLPHVAGIPSIIFDTPSLVQLALDGMCNIIPDDNGRLFINLPNLKILRLTLTDLNCNLMPTLFKSCPLLEDLSICATFWSHEESYIVDISTPNLKRFNIHGLRVNNSDFFRNHKFVVDAPLLEYCDI